MYALFDVDGCLDGNVAVDVSDPAKNAEEITNNSGNKTLTKRTDSDK